MRTRGYTPASSDALTASPKTTTLPARSSLRARSPRPVPALFTPRSFVTLIIFLTFFVFMPGPPASTEEPAKESLFARTLTRDLETAERRELLEWAESLGLDTRGSRLEVENRILDYYDVPRYTPEEAPDDQDGMAMRIERARGSRFFDLQQVDERNLRLIGGVRLTVEDDGAVHTIEAEEILINTERNTLGARGEVYYEVRRSDGEETFRGDEIIFNIESWEGIFLRGITETRDTIEDEEIDFSVQGDRISRTGEDIIVIEGGTITSSKAEPPNWRIRSSRIWILAPGEWGLRHAVLYVGRVPMFYLPAFFLPGDRLFFHPVVGSRTREGGYIQTTTYFFGQREDDSPPLSIMSIAEVPDESERVIDGLFLRIPEEPRESRRPDWNVKLMADLYMTLGAYTGIAAEMPNLGPLSRFDWRLGLGASRNIYFEDNVYSSFYVEDGEAREHWNSGFFIGRSVPYRYEIETVGRAGIESLRLNWNFLLLSDPEFRRDFHVRSERMDWSFIINPDVEEEETGTSVTSLNWQAGFDWSPDVDTLNPWLSSFSLSPVRAQALWRTREDDRDDPDWASAVRRPTSDRSPEDRFFYPQSVTLPELQGRIRGTVWQYPRVVGRSEPERQEEAPAEEDAELRPPWESPEREETEEVESDREQFRLPERIGSLRGLRDPDRGGASFSYDLRPSLRYDRFTENADWITGSDVEWSWRYSTFQTRNRGNLSLEARSRDQFATASTELRFDQRFQSLDITQDIDETEEERLELDAFRFRGYTFDQASQVMVFPLRTVEPLERSSLRYSLSSLVYDYSFLEREEGTGDPVYESRWGEWDEEDVTTHQTRARMQWDVLPGSQTLTVTSDLLPRDRSYLGELQLQAGPLTTRLTGGYRERPVSDGDDEKEWKPENFVQTHTMALFDSKLRLEQRLEHDLEEEELLQSRSSLRMWPITMRLLGRQEKGYDFDPVQGWIARTEEADRKFRWTNYSLGIAGEQELRGWHRRITASLQGELSLDFDLQRYANTSFVVDFGFGFSIYRFLDFNVTARSRNDVMYQYVDSFADELGRTRRPLFEDLWQSINVFDRDQREDSPFKIDSFELSLVHYLEDWVLELGYSGRPELEDDPADPRYEWRSLLTVLLRWRPIAELRRGVTVDEDGTLEFTD